MSGLVSEAHWDARTTLIVRSGPRRYILVTRARAGPATCTSTRRAPVRAPVARGLVAARVVAAQFPRFASMPRTRSSGAGRRAVLPTFYLHFVNSVDTNYQCNAERAEK